MTAISVITALLVDAAGQQAPDPEFAARVLAEVKTRQL